MKLGNSLALVVGVALAQTGSAFVARPIHSSRASADAVLLRESSPSNDKDGDAVATVVTSSSSSTNTATNPPPTPTSNDQFLSQETFGGYTVKQRLREEVESPFRKVRFLFFAGSTGSALTALYFSALSTVKAAVGGYSDAPPLQEALTNDAINIGAAIVCGVLAYRDYQAGQANLERIARGGKLASLVVEPAASEKRMMVELKQYRRKSRVLICAGGKDYIRRLALSLTSDQLADENSFAESLVQSDVVVVPLLLNADGASVTEDATKQFWNEQVEPASDDDRNFDISRADPVVAFPKGARFWSEYIESEVETADGQGFNVLEKGITLTVKKNGRILRRATGLPPWGELIATMEVMDGSRFGMPGDSERYGGP
uniref:Peptidase M14 carboxypeptidase A domain-containing protein n=1 Tax=Craspedostauros australis TaxID=1486917 RepID=A0A7R9ZPU1_9STRA|mmetsp:Transcript_502/g.1413  ORF Transcript_502/g.1413 Transcript_502/m.1413 type:complete len:374 (+) Transcript_502:119-1240(+)